MARNRSRELIELRFYAASASDARDCVRLILPFFNAGHMHFPESAQAIVTAQTGELAGEFVVTRGRTSQPHPAGANR
jgi:hypothetical protein